MFFAGLFAMYFTVRANNLNVWPGAPALDKQPAYHVHLTVGYATVFTIILVASSVTCQWGVFAAERGDVFGLRRWFFLTFLMGLIFVCGQANEYRNQVGEYHHLVNGLHESGMTLSSSGYGSVFYLTTGFHGLHVTGGLHRVPFLAGAYLRRQGRFTHEQATVSAIVVSYYWHFVDVVWIGLFTTIYLIQ